MSDTPTTGRPDAVSGVEAAVATATAEAKLRPRFHGSAMKKKTKDGVPAGVPGRRWDLLAKLPLLDRILKMRSFQFLTILPNLLVFQLLLLAGFLGTPVGNRNIIIVFIWILWWFALIALMVPFASRIWCTMCPLPFFGDWIQRLALWKVRPGKTGGLKNKMYGLNRRWPKAVTNIWLQNIGFLALCTFSAVLVTRPIVTAAVLGSFIVLAVVLGLVYRMRAFCNYVCPVSGFLSLYAMASTLELRSRDWDVCVKCKTKACRAGNDKGWACPWYVYLGRLDRNNYCGFCMECLKACPNDNIALNVRPFASDVRLKGYDEAWKGFIMLALAMAYSVILLGPSGTIKTWANATESGDWAGFGIYAAILWGSALLLVPAVFWLCARLSRTLAGGSSVPGNVVPMKRVFLSYAYVMVPLGLLAWIAFSVPLIFVNGSYILVVMSDPFGWGWDLLGTAHTPWTPLIPEYLGYLQMPILGVGLAYALKRAYQIGLGLFGDDRRAARGLVPIGIFSTAVTLAFMVFFVG